MRDSIGHIPVDLSGALSDLCIFPPPTPASSLDQSNCTTFPWLAVKLFATFAEMSSIWVSLLPVFFAFYPIIQMCGIPCFLAILIIVVRFLSSRWSVTKHGLNRP